jgi:hypothetical protein
VNLRSVAVDQAKIYHRQQRQQFQSQLEPQLNEQLELTLQDSPHSASKRQQRRDNERQRIHRSNR